MMMLEKARDALETAADKILVDYRTWVADDTEAKPRYGQIPEYDAVNAAIGEIDYHIRALTPAEAGGLVERIRDYADKPHADRYVIRDMAEKALKAAMEAGR